MMMMLMKNLSFCHDYKFFVRPQEEKGVCSQEREETPRQPEEVVAFWNSGRTMKHDVLPDANPRRNREDRHGTILRSGNSNQSTVVSCMRLHSQVKIVLQGDDLEGGQPLAAW